MQRPILLLEINEVPWKLIDRFLGDPRLPNLAKFFTRSSTYTTVSLDTGELSPWVTWPSLHRGMPNFEHGIKDLGQDVATFKGVPIWEEYRRRGGAIGICGSMQSWPPVDPGEGGFYVPDTFAHDERCFPAWIEPLQRFNLNQVKMNGRTISTKLGLDDLPALLRSLPKLGLRPKTLARLAKQLAEEKIDSNKIAQRPIFQGLLFWDVFKALFKPKTPPMFTTFFTNHVASIMHRYWHHTFPEDFGNRYMEEPKPHKETMRLAMTVVDEILGDALRFQEENRDLLLVFATSMGQDAIRRDSHEGYELWIKDLRAFLSVFGVADDAFKALLAMVPQVVADIPDETKRRQVKLAIDATRTVSGARVFWAQEIGTSLSITLHTPRKQDIEAGGFHDERGGFHAWMKAGVEVGKVEPGTGYHIPEGVMAVHGHGVEVSSARTRMNAPEAKQFLMELSGISERQRERGNGRDRPASFAPAHDTNSLGASV